MIDALVSIERAWYDEEAEDARIRAVMTEELKTARQYRALNVMS